MTSSLHANSDWCVTGVNAVVKLHTDEVIPRTTA